MIYKYLQKHNISKYFEKEIIGYHIINKTPIKQSLWEIININFLSSVLQIYNYDHASHSPGIDIQTNYGSFSNKTSKYLQRKNYFFLSSYRLTSICSPLNVQDPIIIMQNIFRKNQSFDYYSILLRKKSKNIINYKWYLIPRDYYYLNPFNYNWTTSYSVKNNNIIGYKTNEINENKMMIYFSMSSQLWIKLNISEIDKYLISETYINLDEINFIQNYSQLYDIIYYK